MVDNVPVNEYPLWNCGYQIYLQMVTTMFHIATIVYRNAMAEVSATVLGVLLRSGTLRPKSGLFNVAHLIYCNHTLDYTL